MKASTQESLQPSYVHLVCGWQGETKELVQAGDQQRLLCPCCGLSVGIVHREDVGDPEFWAIRGRIYQAVKEARRARAIRLPPEIEPLDHRAAHLVKQGAKA